MQIIKRNYSFVKLSARSDTLLLVKEYLYVKTKHVTNALH